MVWILPLESIFRIVEFSGEYLNGIPCEFQCCYLMILPLSFFGMACVSDDILLMCKTVDDFIVVDISTTTCLHC